MMEKPKSSALTQWTIYWAICVSGAFLEQNLFFLLVEYFPLYQELKLLIFLWLVHPDYLGAAWIWYAKLKDLHKPLDAEFYGKIMGALGPLGKEPAAAPAEEEKKEEKKDE